jgi:hypothetical protein
MRYAILSLALSLGAASAQQADLVAALAGGATPASFTQQQTSGSLLRKQDFPAYPIVDSLFHLSTGDQLRLRWWGIGTGTRTWSLTPAGI